jgi:phosphoglycolate phosphatase
MPLFLQNYKHILWDWNGTLFNDVELCVRINNALLEKRGLPLITLESYRAYFRFPVQDYYRDLGFDFDRDSYENLSIEFMDPYEKLRFQCPLQPHAPEVLSRIRVLGLKQSILSAYSQNSLRELVRHFELDSFFEEILGLDDIYGRSKLEIGRQWLQNRGYAPAEVLLIGDSHHDAEVAAGLGLDCLLVAGGHNSRTRLQSNGTRVIDRLSEIF